MYWQAPAAILLVGRLHFYFGTDSCISVYLAGIVLSNQAILKLQHETLTVIKVRQWLKFGLTKGFPWNNTRPPDFSGYEFSNPVLKSLALGLQSSVRFKLCWTYPSCCGTKRFDKTVFWVTGQPDQGILFHQCARIFMFKR